MRFSRGSPSQCRIDWAAAVARELRRTLLPSLGLVSILLAIAVLPLSIAAYLVRAIAHTALLASAGFAIGSAVNSLRGKERISLAALILVAVSFALSRPAVGGIAAGLHNRLYPDRLFHELCDALRSSPVEPEKFSREARNWGRMLQARGLDDGRIEELAESLEVHFDRYGRNETERFITVESLNLIGNFFGTRGVKAISEALSHEDAYTETLLLGRNRRVGDGSLYALADLMKANKSIRWLGVGGPTGKMSQNGFEALFDSLVDRPMDFLGFDYNRHIRSQLHLIGKANMLQEVDLTGTKLGDAHIPSLVDAIQQTNITKLGLTNSGIGSKGIQTLFPLVSTLTELELGLNPRIKDAGAKILASALRSENATLERLDLFKSGICDEGAQAFATIFPENGSLKFLTLELSSSDRKGSCIKQDTWDAIRAGLEANQARGKVPLVGN